MKLNNNSVLIGAFLLILIQSTPGYSQELVKDINALPDGFSEQYIPQDFFCECGGYLYFLANDNLWKTDGTAEGTNVVSTFLTDISGYACLNEVLYFAARSESNEADLWKTSASLPEPQPVKDIIQSFENDDIVNFNVLNNKLLFFAFRGDRYRLWQSDGTPEGTSIVVEETFTAYTYLASTVVTEDYMFFTLLSSGQRRLWRTDGTEGNIVLLTESLIAGLDLVPIMGNVVFFSGYDPETLEYFLCRSDGTVEGTVRVSLAEVDRIFPFGDKVIFETSWSETWISDGTEAGTHFLIFGEIQTGVVYEDKFYGIIYNYDQHFLFTSDGTQFGTETLVPLGGPSYGDLRIRNEIPVLAGKFLLELYDETHGAELGISDGTEVGTQLVKDIYPGSSSSFINGWKVFNGSMIFLASDDIHGNELWTTDGTGEGTFMIKDIVKGTRDGFVNTPFFRVWKDRIYFQEFYQVFGINNFRLWTTDGTDAGTAMYHDFGNTFRSLGDLNDELYFFSTSLYKTGGNSQSLQLVKDFQFLGYVWHDYPAYVLDDKLIFLVQYNSLDENYGKEFWVTDGTEAGTKLVKDINPGTGDGGSTEAGLLNNVVIFRGNDGSSGLELWRTDGTEEGTVQVKDINVGASASSPAYFVGLNDFLLFAADNGTNGTELWRTDGTEAGTVLVADLIQGEESSYPRFMKVVDDQVFFVADNAGGGLSLWKTNGTAEGTSRIKSFNGFLNGYYAVAIGKRLFFVAEDGVHGWEPWVSDGTAAGTFVFDVTPGAASSDLGIVAPAGTWYYFEVNRKLWRTNGSKGDVQFVADVQPFQQMIFFNDWLYFPALISDEYGRELYRIAVPDSNLEPEPVPEPEPEPVASIEGTLVSQFKVYPNPASETLWIKSPYLNEEHVTAEIISSTGQPLGAFRLSGEGLTEHSVKPYPTGIFVLKINTGKEVLYYKFVRE